MSYKVLDIYKDLPKSNCGECGSPGCFQFATAVYLDQVPIRKCTQVTGAAMNEMERRLFEGRGMGEGKMPPNNEQALTRLREEMAAADLASLAKNAGAEYLSGPPESIRLELFGQPYKIDRTEAEALAGERPNLWVKVFLFIYLTRANGNPAAGSWVGFRELPNTISKAKSFEEQGEKLARHFEGRASDLAAEAERLGGRAVDNEAADLAFHFHALPRVDLLLYFWDGDEDFPARASILVDRGVFDYLDPEATVFLAEALVAQLTGEGLGDLVG